MEAMEQTLKTKTAPNDVSLYRTGLGENSSPTRNYSVQEVFDELDQGFIEFYGEYGRQLVNERRARWNNDGLWEFKLF